MIKRICCRAPRSLARSYFGLPPGLKEDAAQRFADFVAQRNIETASRFPPDPYVSDKHLPGILTILEAISPAFQKPGFKRNLKVPVDESRCCYLRAEIQ